MVDFDPAAPFGPYVPPEGGPLECTIIVKAAPERSKKYGETVCTAALLDDGRFIRLYPIPIDEYWRDSIPKWTRVSLQAKQSDENASRPESHKVEDGLHKVASPLLRTNAGTPWDARMELVRKAVNAAGMAGVRSQQTDHGTSLAIVKVRELLDFRITAALDNVVEQADRRVSPQQTLTGEVIMEGSRIDKVHHVFRYTWRCFGRCCDDDAEGQGYHDTTCEDWELFQSFRQWRKAYPDDLEFMQALKNMYFDCMAQSDLHFAMGTPSDPARQNSWMIVGLVYPGRPQRHNPEKSTLAGRQLPPDEVVRPDADLDEVASRDGRTAGRSLSKSKAKTWF